MNIIMNCFKNKKPTLVPVPSDSHPCCCCCKANPRCQSRILTAPKSQNGNAVRLVDEKLISHHEHPSTVSSEDGNFFSKRRGTLTITDSDSEKVTPCYAWMARSLENDRTNEMEDESRGAFGPDNIQEIAYMPVKKHSPFYNMDHPRRGKAVIFNFDHWDNTMIPELGLSPRKGSAKDKMDLARTLEKFDFDVHCYDSCSSLAFWDIIFTLRAEDHSSADCLLVCLMTHGERNTVFMADGTQIPVNLIWEAFEANRCPTLAGKPKIFIVQACRGRGYDNGTILSGGRNLAASSLLATESDVTDSGNFSYVIPNSADFIIAFSCPLGHYSWRNPEYGSWFVQSICKIFDTHGYDMDLQSLFTEVARDVALNYESSTTHYASDKKKQVTSTSSTLIRKVIFKPNKKAKEERLSPPTIIDNGMSRSVDEIPTEFWTESNI